MTLSYTAPGASGGHLVPAKARALRQADIRNGVEIDPKEHLRRCQQQRINDSPEIFCENRQNLVKQRITPHFLTTDHPNYYEFTTKG